MTIEKKDYNKLVRDRIPEIIKNKNEQCDYRIIVDNQEFELELKKKIVEESTELLNAESDNIPGEIVDILELIDTLIKTKKLNKDDILKLQQQKREERGGYEEKIFLKWSSYK